MYRFSRKYQSFPAVFSFSDALQMGCCRIASIFSVYCLLQSEFSLACMNLCILYVIYYIEAAFRYQMLLAVTRQGM
jgi:hypothetical protein